MSVLSGRFERFSVIKSVIAVIILSLFLTAVVEIAAATKFKTQVKITGEESLGINPLPSALDYGDLPRGTGETKFVILENRGNRPVYIMVLIVGGIRNLLKVNKNRFVLEGKKKARLSFQLRIPPSAPLKTYRGMVYIFRFPYLYL